MELEDLNLSITIFLLGDWIAINELTNFDPPPWSFDVKFRDYAIAADIQSRHRPHIGDSIRKGDNTPRLAWVLILLCAISVSVLVCRVISLMAGPGNNPVQVYRT
jgi:hypothetical protein